MRCSSFLVPMIVGIGLILQHGPIVAQEYRGAVTGKVIDARTLEPVPQVNVVIVQDPATGAVTDTGGVFTIRGLGVGTYGLRVSAIGYAARIVTNVVVTTGRSTPVIIRLEQDLIEVEEVTSRADYFARAQQMSPLSASVFNRAEVLRLPGGMQDVQRVLQNTPGVASTTDNINELIVRGGAPFENLVVMDRMEIPSINHFANQFNSAGPINMVNADMIEDVQFSTGGFPAQFGDKTASVMNLSVREGNRNRPFAAKAVMNIAGLGLLAEGGFAGGRGSYIVSARNSLLEVVDAMFGLSTLSLTAVPKYWDVQTKIAFDVSPSVKLSLNGIYGNSRIEIAGDPMEEDELRKNTVDSSSVERLLPVTSQYAIGANLMTLFGSDGYGVLTVYSSGMKTVVDVTQEYGVRIRGAQGEVLSYVPLNIRPVFSNSSLESFLGARYELSYQLHPDHALAGGVQIQTALRWHNRVWNTPDTSRYDRDRDGGFETGPVVTPGWQIDQRLGFGTSSKYFMFLSDTYKPIRRLALTFGLRYDHFTYSGKGSLAPRFSIAYELVPPTTRITLATGRYTQTHPLPYYGDRRGLGYNRSLDPMEAYHLVLGVDHVLDEGLRLTVEGYYKKYRKSAVSEDFIYSAVDTFWSDRYLTVGNRTAFGMDLLLEQKQVRDIFGTFSFSWSQAREEDPRLPPLAGTYPSEFDYPLIVTAVGGGVVKGWRNWIENAPWYVKYPLWILPFSNEMELSFRYRYQSGRPYTEQEYVMWKQRREGGIRWSPGTWVPMAAQYGGRYAPYSRLDLQLLSRFYMNTWNINVYLGVINVLNTKNVFFQSYRSDGTVETVYQFSLFPVFGVEAEF